MRIYVHNYSAHGHELSGCVRADADAFNINFCIVLLCSLHGPGPGPVLCRVLSRKIIFGGKLVLRAVLVAPGGGCGRGVCPVLRVARKLSPF